MSKISKAGIAIGQIIRAEHLLRIINALSGEVPNTQIEISGSVTGSVFTGSFVGDGSGLTGLPTGSSTTPGGLDTNIQFNSGSTFAGSGDFRYNYTNKKVIITGSAEIKGLGNDQFSESLRLTNSDGSSSLVVNDAGDVYNRGVNGINTNTFFGENVGRLTTGGTNTAMGTNVLESNTTGGSNSAVGVSTLRNNTTGFSNSALGREALRNNTLGNLNSAIGVSALQNNTTGSNNTAIGMSALTSNTIGNDNTAVGVSALVNNITGSNNIALGFEAGRRRGTANNTLLMASSSIFIGRDTRANADNQTNQIVIGDSAVGLGSNTTVIGNTSTIITALRGRVLLGTNFDNGGDRLQISGSLKGSGSFSYGDSTQATGLFSHAIGLLTTAGGNFSHAEGRETYVEGIGSHAEGENTAVYGEYSHAEGIGTIIYGNYSHAEGLGTIAEGDYQHVQGQFNLESSVESAFIVGNGEDEETRSNLIHAAGNLVEITGSVSITDVLTLPPVHPLPSSPPTGSFAVSGSGANCKPYFWNGTWNALF
jgi:hypothetical protein